MRTHEPHQPRRARVRLLISRDWRDDPLAALAALRTASTDAAELELQAVALARARGASWEAIGEALGVSRQAAWERFGELRNGCSEARKSDP